MQKKLERTTFETPRAEEYFTPAGLTKQTGLGPTRFVAVAIKELADNALDACEYAGVRPEIGIGVKKEGSLLRITVADNGPGLDTQKVEKILNFNTRTSDKAAYRSPTRGAQGNALKTVLGMPHALGSEEPVLIESQGVCHRIRCWLDPAGELRKKHSLSASSRTRGTRVSLALPASMANFHTEQLLYWARASSLLNPHAIVRIEGSGEESEQC